MSLKIEKKNEGTKDTVFLTGRLDTATAPELDTFAEKELLNTQELVLDFTGLEYISSAGLRVILKMQKFMNVKGTMKLIHVSDTYRMYSILRDLQTYCQSNDCGCKDTELHSEKEDSIYLN